MAELKLSVAIPYKQRLSNLRLCFEALTHQTMERTEFEVVVGAMEYCPDYLATCREYSDRLNIVSVVSAQAFEIPRARNLAMRQAAGRVCVQIDADTLLQRDALANLYERNFAFGQNLCVAGQVVGYDNNEGGDIASVPTVPFAHYQGPLQALRESIGSPADPRFRVDHVIPWSFAWTGLIALPMATVRKHDLFFDETFRGWGVDDLEWGYRISASGTPIVLREDVQAIHLPHTRDAAANRKTGKRNFERLLNKWPGIDVELVKAFGDIEANALFRDFQRELRKLCSGESRLGSARGSCGGRDALVVGVALDARGRLIDADALAMFDNAARVEVLPYTGLALPYGDGTLAEVRLLPSILSLPAKYRDAVRTEAERVASAVVLPSRASA